MRRLNQWIKISEITQEATRAEVAVPQAQTDVGTSAGGGRHSKRQRRGEDKKWNMADADRQVFSTNEPLTVNLPFGTDSPHLHRWPIS